jgi:two-component system, LytTR family, sensor kinase
VTNGIGVVEGEGFAENGGPPASGAATRRVRPLAAVGMALGVATLLAAVFTLQASAAIQSTGVEPKRWILFQRQLLFWYLWAFLLPIVWIADRFIRARLWRFWSRLAAWAVLGTGLAVTQGVLFAGGLALAGADGRGSVVERALAAFRFSFAENLLNFAVLGLAYQLFVTRFEARERELRLADIRQQLAHAELDRLRGQLRPHFLFNALNTVSAVMETDREAARGLLMRMGDLLRLSLERLGTETVSLEDELEFTRGYLEVQSRRFEDRLRVVERIGPGATAAAVPPFILQPLVENVIHHAVEARLAPVSLHLELVRDGDRLRITVRDDGPGFDPARPATGTGVGLRNTRARLQRLYGAGHEFVVRSAPGEGCTVTVILPASPPAVPVHGATGAAHPGTGR